MKKFNRKDLVEIVAEEGHFSKKEARQAIDLVFDLIKQSLLDGQEVNITNFGVFTPKVHKPRKGTHPKEHTIIKIDETRSVSFRLSKTMKRRMNK